MTIEQLTKKKTEGKVLTKKEIEYFVNGFCKDEISNQQATDFLRAVYNNGMNIAETTDLTISMAHSGKIIDLSDVGDCIDKHSTGGVSDTTTLVIVPLLASLGVKVAKMSGHKLGWTGGTADKIEVFDGYDNYITTDNFKHNIKQIGASIITQSDETAIADKKIYALRDQTGLVDNISLIASSIMSKKIACGAKYLILDVKYGDGAFMKSFRQAKQLAKVMCKIGNKAGIKTCAIISNMNEPLSNYIGNNLEVYSALEVLNGKENNLSKLCYYLTAAGLKLCEKVDSIEQGIELAKQNIKNKKALEKLKQIVLAQNGSVEIIEKYDTLLKSNYSVDIKAKKSGYLSKVHCKALGDLVHQIAEMENNKQDKNYCGIVLEKEKNDYVKKNDILATIHFASDIKPKKIIESIENCFEITNKKGKTFELVKEIIF